MHQDNPCAVLGDHRQHTPIGTASTHVIDPRSASLQSGLGHPRLGGVDGQGNGEFGGQGLDDGQDALQFLGLADRLRSWPRGFPAHIQHPRALLGQTSALFHGAFCVQEPTPVRKAVGGHVEYTHQLGGGKWGAIRAPGIEQEGGQRVLRRELFQGSQIAAPEQGVSVERLHPWGEAFAQVIDLLGPRPWAP